MRTVRKTANKLSELDVALRPTRGPTIGSAASLPRNS